jgi:hypothetical protein
MTMTITMTEIVLFAAMRDRLVVQQSHSLHCGAALQERVPDR